MFGLGASEMVVIGIVALIVIGPKDLPGLFRTMGQFTGKARMMARELPELGLISNLVEFPAVARGQARFRLQVMAAHTEADLERAANAMAKAMKTAQALLASDGATGQALAG